MRLTAAAVGMSFDVGSSFPAATFPRWMELDFFLVHRVIRPLYPLSSHDAQWLAAADCGLRGCQLADDYSCCSFVQLKDPPPSNVRRNARVAKMLTPIFTVILYRRSRGYLARKAWHVYVETYRLWWGGVGEPIIRFRVSLVSRAQKVLTYTPSA